MSETQTPPQDGVPNCPKCGGAMWDNRVGKRNPKAPDFKCRDKGCEGVVWPPRDAAAAAAAPVDTTYEKRDWPAPAGTPDDPACPTCGGKMWDDRVSKRNPRAPDFKCRNKPKVMGGPGCPGVIWPPREGEQRASSGASRPTPNASARTNVSPANAGAPPKYDAPPPTDHDYPGYENDEDLPF